MNIRAACVVFATVTTFFCLHAWAEEAGGVAMSYLPPRSLMASAVAQASAMPALQAGAANVATKTNYVASLCRAQHPYAGTSEWGQNRVIGVELTAMQYLRKQLKRNADLPLASNAKVEKYPQHGTLDIGYSQPGNIRNGDQEYWRYTPDPGYEHGNDHATFLVDVQGTLVRVVVVLKVRQQKGSDAQWADICPPDYQVISRGIGNGDLLSTWQRQSALNAMLAEAPNSLGGIQELFGFAVAQTTGE